MAQVVQQCRAHGNPRPARVELGAEQAPQDGCELSGGMEDPDAMRKAGMRGSRKNEFGKAELTDAPQPLELPRIEQPPDQLRQAVVARKHDEPVDRIAEPLSFPFGYRSIMAGSAPVDR
jgi:hypothetical protein